ncbi:hypothetical protein D3C86_1444730 [compost metagenome]
MQVRQVGQIIFAHFGQWPALFKCTSELFEHRRFSRLVAVQLKHCITQMTFIESTLDHFKGGHLFGHEQHRFFLGNQFRDDVCDGLRLTGTRWPLDNQVGALSHFENRFGLATVCIFDESHFPRLEHRVDVHILGIGRMLVTETRPKEPVDDRVGIGLLVLRPALRIQILEHQELAEGKESEGSLVC